MRLAQYVLLGVGGVRALEAMGIEPGHRAPQRGPRRVRGARARRRDYAADGLDVRRRAGGRPRAARSSPPTRRSPPATTPTRPSQVARRARARSPARSASTPRRSSRSAARTPTTSTSRSASRSSRCARSRAANGVSRRHGEVAREMWRALWPRPRRSTTCRSRHVTNGVHMPDLARRADARRCSTATSARAGFDRADGPRDVGRDRRRSRTRSCGPCASSSAPS